MTSSCECGNPEYVAAVDLKLVPNHMPGNKYCRICTNCGTRHFCSRSHFEGNSNKHVIPVKETQPREAAECPDCGWTWVTKAHTCARCGDNIFPCPNCDEQVHGEPQSCPHCDVEYRWETASDSDADTDAEKEAA